MPDHHQPDPAGLAPPCVQSGTVSGIITKANVIPVIAQGIDAVPGTGATDDEFASLVKAIRAGVTYANVHSANAGGVATRFNSGEIRGQIRADRDGTIGADPTGRA